LQISTIWSPNRFYLDSLSPVAARLTGLSVHVLRSWERRYGAVRPRRTARGSRRYTPADVARLRMLRAAVGSGHPISALAPLSDASIAALLEPRGDTPGLAFEEVLSAIARLDAREVERLLAFQLFARGPRSFARDFVLPLFVEIGARRLRHRPVKAHDSVNQKLTRLRSQLRVRM
jgi:DNA-binding transcriptional MerR regulator